jgi:hypothetical protein
MTGSRPKSIQSYISGEAAARARQAELLRKQFGPLWEQVVGPDLAKHSYAVRLEGRCLLIHADGSLWANQIRHRYAEYVERLQQFPELRQLAELRVRVVPASSVVRPRASPTVRPQLSQGAGKVIEGVAQGIEDETLREALLRLSRRAK